MNTFVVLKIIQGNTELYLWIFYSFFLLSYFHHFTYDIKFAFSNDSILLSTACQNDGHVCIDFYAIYADTSRPSTVRSNISNTIGLY